ncbi:lycopene beta-cyclase CrtY [Novosphingobium sp.]|uniref:lycopene beta-cyclase CrtY n=1 Tax=Novosphingobium sp. TaxID=1874826 RepID=UPI001ECF89F6|nr:lycopene beta-cyclase CrtY [Novosphingobium sp.]MBK9010099.1 lycopene beta-cyclase CrtY [Novosphingobium sp.]
MSSTLPLVIVGGGLAGALAAVRLAERRPELPLLLVDAGKTIGGNHTWSFFDSDVPAGSQALVASLRPVRWPRHRVRFPGRERELAVAYNSIAAPALDALVRARLPQSALRLGARAARITAEGIELADGEWIAARGVIDARGPHGAMPGLDLGWQKFVGIEFEAAAPEPDCATVMDACLPQIDGYRFVYVLPFGPDRVLVEDTYYSDAPDLDGDEVARRVRALAAERGLGGYELRRETGVLPILIGGDPQRFWPAEDPVARLGLAGGFFHATTGYSFSLALRLADELSMLEGDFTGAELARWTRERFLRHWRETRYFRMLNRMLFRAARPEERWRVFAHFYRLPPQRIARFYAGQLTALDRMRILSGRPPVSIGAALKALLG